MKMMKTLMAISALVVAGAAQADSTVTRDQSVAAITLHNLVLRDFSLTALDLINWKVGDTTTYSIEMGAFGNMGTMVKSATKEEGGAVWVKNDANLMGQADVTEILINRADGKILKMLHNGQEQQAPNDEIEVISQDYTEITVPAGKFKCLHIVAKSKDVSKMEIWANPQAVPLDGSIQMIMDTQFGQMTLKLTTFKKI
jgi:hypothetical protein